MSEFVDWLVGGLIIAGVIGYLLNIWKIILLFGGTIGTEFVLRLVGVFFGPLGAILGYF